MQNFTTNHEILDDCQICLDSKDIGFVRKCAHEICHSCAHRVKKCPFCRGPMNLPLLDEKLNCERFSPTPSPQEFDYDSADDSSELEYDSADDSSEFED